MIKSKTAHNRETKKTPKLAYAKRYSNDVVVRGGCTSSTTSSCGIAYRQG